MVLRFDHCRDEIFHLSMIDRPWNKNANLMQSTLFCPYFYTPQTIFLALSLSLSLSLSRSLHSSTAPSMDPAWCESNVRNLWRQMCKEKEVYLKFKFNIKIKARCRRVTNCCVWQRRQMSTFNLSKRPITSWSFSNRKIYRSSLILQSNLAYRKSSDMSDRLSSRRHSRIHRPCILLA